MKLSGSTYVSLLLAGFVLLCSRGAARPLDDILVGSGDAKSSIYASRKMDPKSGLKNKARVYSPHQSAVQVRRTRLFPDLNRAAFLPGKAPATLNKFIGGAHAASRSAPSAGEKSSD